MNRGANKKFVDSTIAFTQSSFTYKDPYMPKGNILYKTKNKVQSFVAMRSMENEFVDFKTYQMHD